MHSPHYALSPPGWRRSQRGRLYRNERDGRRVVLLAPEARRGWRAAVYRPGTARAEIVELRAILPTEGEHVAARHVAATLHLEATTGNAPWVARHRRERATSGPAGPPRP